MRSRDTAVCGNQFWTVRKSLILKRRDAGAVDQAAVSRCRTDDQHPVNLAGFHPDREDLPSGRHRQSHKSNNWTRPLSGRGPLSLRRIQGVAKDHGIEPAPQRRASLPWKTFLAAHWDSLAAADFFTVEVVTLRGLVRYVVLFVMKLKTRTVEIAGMTSQPNETWMLQIARNLTGAGDGFLRGIQHLILDRDPLYTAAFGACCGTAACRQWSSLRGVPI